MLSSFDALQSILKVGQEVKVRDEWRTIQGRLESLSADELVISTRLGLFRGRADLTFRENVIKRIDIADSTWNGFAIGAAAGFGGMFVHYRSLFAFVRQSLGATVDFHRALRSSCGDVG